MPFGGLKFLTEREEDALKHARNELKELLAVGVDEKEATRQADEVRRSALRGTSLDRGRYEELVRSGTWLIPTHQLKLQLMGGSILGIFMLGASVEYGEGWFRGILGAIVATLLACALYPPVWIEWLWPRPMSERAAAVIACTSLGVLSFLLAWLGGLLGTNGMSFGTALGVGVAAAIFFGIISLFVIER